MKKLLLLILFCSGLLHAQEPSSADALISLSFKTIGFGFGRNDVFIKQAKGYTQLAIEPDCISIKSYAYTGPAVMLVYHRVKTADKISYEPIGEVSFPPIDPKQAAKFLLIFSGSNTGALDITTVADDLAAFPLQSIRVINALPVPAGVMVSVEINKSTQLIPPGQTQLFPVHGAKNDRIEIQIAVQHRGKWIVANNTVSSCDSTSRRTLFLINNSAPDAPAYQPPAIGFLSLIDHPGEKQSPSAETADL
jgi:hypothetical protein